MRFPFTINDQAISIFYNGKMHSVPRSNKKAYEALRDHLKGAAHDAAVVATFVDVAKTISRMTEGAVTVVANTVYYAGQAVHDVLAEKLVAMLDEGFDVLPWARFMDRVQKNPTENSRKSLYSFLEKHGAPITEDGCFLAFKRVTKDYKDIYTKTFDNSIGRTVEVQRDQVDPDINRTCSRGLHVAASSYLDSYASADKNKTIVVKVDPADVVAVPADYNHAKMRVTKYVVLGDAVEAQYNEFKTALVMDEEKVKPVSVDEKPAEPQKKQEGKKTSTSKVFTHRGKSYALADIKKALQKTSQRAFCRSTGIPRSTLQGWLAA